MKTHEEMEEISKFKIEGFVYELIPGQELRWQYNCTHSLMLRVPKLKCKIKYFK